jgi:hypothetical protein
MGQDGAHPLHSGQAISRRGLWIYNACYSTHLQKLRPVTSNGKKQ